MLERGPRWRIFILGGLLMPACSGSITTSDTDEGVANGGDSSTVAAMGGAGGSGSDDAGGASAGSGDASAGGVSVAGSDGGRADAGKAGAGDPGGGAEPDPNRVYCDAVTTVFRTNCAPSCHGNERVGIGDFAVGFEQAAALVDRPSIRNAGCGVLINSKFPAQSMILTKVTGAYRRDIDCGAQMPTGPFGELSFEEIACIADWLEQFQR